MPRNLRSRFHSFSLTPFEIARLSRPSVSIFSLKMEPKKVFLFVFVLAVAEASYLKELRDKLNLLNKKSELKTLKEFLRENPNLGHESLEKRETLECNEVCGPLPGVDGNVECREWAPDYKSNGKCRCIVQFKCCPDPCPKPKQEVCWGPQKGYKYPVVETDCCGCDIYACHDCTPVAKPDEICELPGKNYPLSCFSYNATGLSDKVTQCYEANCPFTPPPPPTAETCDFDCMRTDPRKDECGQGYDVCVSNKVKSDCPLDSQEESAVGLKYGLHCYHAPKEVPHPIGGKWYLAHKCVDCVKWDYHKKSCDDKNLRAANYACPHQNNTFLDKVCWDKIIKHDSCDCDVPDCERAPQRSATHKFPAGERCPTGYKKVTGVSICDYPRDVCLKCPDLEDPDDCDLNIAKIGVDRDANDCPVRRCKWPTVPKGDCDSDTYFFDKTKKEFFCIPKPMTCFEFPASELKANVVVHPLIEKNLKAFTFDIHYTITQMTSDVWFFSVAHSRHDNIIVIGPKRGIHLESGALYSELTPSLGKSTRLTLTYDGETGNIKVYENGQPERTANRKNTVLLQGSSVMLGQEQDSVGGRFDPNQRFIGKLCGFQMWDRVLSDAELKQLFEGKLQEKGNVFDSPATYMYELNAGAKETEP